MTTWDTSWSALGVVYSNGDLTASNDGTSVTEWPSARSTTAHSSGKRYAELLVTQGSDFNTGAIGFGVATADPAQWVGEASDTWGLWCDGTLFNNGTDTATTAVISDGETARLAADFDAGKAWLGDAIEWAGGGDPASGTLPTFTFTPGTLFHVMCSPYRDATPDDSITANFGATAFTHAVPSGFSAWDTAAVPLEDSDYFGNRYFGARYFGGGYFGPESEIVVPPVVAELRPGGITHRRKRRRILLDDGRIYIPATDEEYQDYIETLLRSIVERQERAAEPVKPKRRRKRAAKAQPPPMTAKMVLPSPLPAGFYEALAQMREDVLNYSLISRAWVNYLAEVEEDEETVTLLLLS